MARISYEEALALSLAVPLPDAPEHVLLEHVAGRVLREDLVYGSDLPSFDHAAMDGYAVLGAAAIDMGFAVRGESRAGLPHAAIVTGHAVAISTGAVLPMGTDTVIPWEDVVREGDAIRVTRAARADRQRIAQNIQSSVFA